MHGSLEHSLDQHLALETEEIVSAAGTDAAEGLAAFVDKRRRLSAASRGGNGLLDDLEIVSRVSIAHGSGGRGGLLPDWTGRFVGSLRRSFDRARRQVAAVVDSCRAAGVAVVPRKAANRLGGRRCPLEGELVDRSRGSTEVEVDGAPREATVGRRVDRAAPGRGGRRSGWRTQRRPRQPRRCDARGTDRHQPVVRSAALRDTVRGSSAWKPCSGPEWSCRTSPVARDGYHLPVLLTGSEGTLGIVMRAFGSLPGPERDGVAGLRLPFRRRWPGGVLRRASRSASRPSSSCSAMESSFVCKFGATLPFRGVVRDLRAGRAARPTHDVVERLSEVIAAIAGVVRGRRGGVGCGGAPRVASAGRRARRRSTSGDSAQTRRRARHRAGRVRRRGSRVHDWNPGSVWLFGPRLTATVPRERHRRGSRRRGGRRASSSGSWLPRAGHQRRA